MEGEYRQEDAYGMIRASRVSGGASLFGVDYPQQHYISVEVTQASVRRDLSNDWYHSGNIIVSADMSEVQWARMIASMNTQGVPCTLKHYRCPQSGTVLRPKMHGMEIPKAALFKTEVADTIKDSTDSLKKAKVIAARMAEGGSLKKGDLHELVRALDKVEQELVSNLPFVLQQAEEAIEDAVESAKGEIEAYTSFSMQKLGERALGHVVEEHRKKITRRD